MDNQEHDMNLGGIFCPVCFGHTDGVNCEKCNPPDELPSYVRMNVSTSDNADASIKVSDEPKTEQERRETRRGLQHSVRMHLQQVARLIDRIDELEERE